MSYDSTIEDMVDNVNSFISDNIATYVTGINDAKADGVTLDAIRKIVVDDADPYSYGIYPVILNTPNTLETETIASGWDRATMEFISVVAVNKGTSATINKKLLRYVEAVRQVLRDFDTLGVSTFDVDKSNMRVAYYPIDPAGSGVKVGTITFRVIKEIPA